MKSLILLCSLFISTSAFAAPFKTVTEAEEKLATFTVADIDGDEQRLASGKSLKINEIFDDLKEAVAVAEKTKLTEELALQMERLCLLASLHDPSNYAVDLILPVYQKNKALFEKASQKLHPYDRKNLIEVLKGKDREATEGNG